MQQKEAISEIVSVEVKLPNLKDYLNKPQETVMKVGEVELHISALNGVGYIWGVFPQPLNPNQIGNMTFTNVPGTLPVAGCFGEWLPSANKPHIGTAKFLLQSVQRGNGIARISGQNTHNVPLVSAAGLTCAIE